MIEIPLHSKKYPGLFALIDDEDYGLVNQYDWYPVWRKASKTFYAKTSDGSEIYMHRLILNIRSSEHTDHKDHNGLDNQKSNIRICNHSQNQANRKSEGGTSKFKGVCWNKQAKKWMARIKLNQKCIYLGYFGGEIEAAQAYDKKARELFGEFALTNQ